MRNGKCTKCGFAKVYVSDENPFQMEIPQMNDRMRTVRSHFVDYLCTACGYFERYIKEPVLLQKVEELAGMGKLWKKVV